ncbi:MAG: ATP-binding cassette domain-containing protein, partial [Clostridiales bacterium]|nr:ATP-binding cassette domain-containing protein [Clostridiales bacterium]
MTARLVVASMLMVISSVRKIANTFNEFQGEFIGIVGLSGAGKSTILKCIHRTYLATQGHIYYNSAAFGRIDLTSASER